MSDKSVAAALRSPARLVVVEAPAGCGKTYQGAQYARDISASVGDGRVLILTHTHAACNMFASHTHGAGGRVDIRTIDSLIAQIAGAYHLSLGLPADTGSWARNRKAGYDELATKVANLLRASPMIARSLAQRYPIVIFDEHQDASADQHMVATACHVGGASVRIFGDPVQRIYGSRKKTMIEADDLRWQDLKQAADAFEELDKPHRWSDGSDALGRWILDARTALRTKGAVDLRGTLPPGVALVVAENGSARHGGYALTSVDRRPIDALVDAPNSLLVLSAQNKTVHALRAFFNRRLPIWEGHVRDHLSTLVGTMAKHKGDAVKIAQAVVTFLDGVAIGFTHSSYGNTLVGEVAGGCVSKRRGKPGTLQGLALLILSEPDHKGAAKMLKRVAELRKTDPGFKAVKIDYHCEFWDAVRIGQFDDPDEGLAEISRRHSYVRPAPPAKAISTVHKAKGLECSDVLIVPCDAKHFGDTARARCLLYVALSRATRSLTFVASRQDQSPLVVL